MLITIKCQFVYTFNEHCFPSLLLKKTFTGNKINCFPLREFEMGLSFIEEEEVSVYPEQHLQTCINIYL